MRSRAEGRRSGSRYPGAVAAVLFLAVCAWLGAALYGALRQGAEANPLRPALAPEGLPLRGIAVRSEEALCSDLAGEALAFDGDKLAAGAPLRRFADGSVLCTPESAVFFTDCDGFETLRPEDLEEMDAAALAALLDREADVPEGAFGRLVLREAWFFAALAPAGQIPEGTRLCRFCPEGADKSVSARLWYIGDAQEGQVPVILRLTCGGDWLRLRKCDARLFFD